jgi:hypothetical protein
VVNAVIANAAMVEMRTEFIANLRSERRVDNPHIHAHIRSVPVRGLCPLETQWGTSRDWIDPHLRVWSGFWFMQMNCRK